MSLKKVDLLIFEGGQPRGEIQKLLAAARQALVLDMLERLKDTESLGRIFLVTNYPRLLREGAALGASVIENQVDPAGFHFGRTLRRLVNAYDIRRLICLGGGGAPLISAREMEEICITVAEGENLVLTNNPQSADLIAFTPAGAINDIRLPRLDNALAAILRDEGGLVFHLYPPTLGTVFDLDTPIDLLILAAGPYAGPRTRSFINTLSLDLSAVMSAKKVLGSSYPEVTLIGRVGAPILAHLNKNLKCRVRVFSEERGMKVLGREREQKVVSLIGHFIESTGVSGFIRYLEQIADCVFWDTRVLFAHLNLSLTEEERFSSDLGRWEALTDPFVREFTAAVFQASIPILLGGHSLVSGSLWALIDEIQQTF